jgi:hypothetical protein
MISLLGCRELVFVLQTAPPRDVGKHAFCRLQRYVPPLLPHWVVERTNKIRKDNLLVPSRKKVFVHNTTCTTS